MEFQLCPFDIPFVEDQRIVLSVHDLLDVIIAFTSTALRLDIISKLTNKEIEFIQSHCFQKV